MPGVVDLTAETAALTGSVRAALEEQQQALAILEAEVAQIDGVTRLLHELPKKLSHRVMVPFGEAAFFPGKLVRTNECMVKLGESHLVECTAFHAAQILGRRRSKLETAIGAARQGLQQSEARLRSASDQLIPIAEDGQQGGVLEIIEDYDPATHRPLGTGPVSSSSKPTSVKAGKAGLDAHEEEDIFLRIAELEAEEEAADAASPDAAPEPGPSSRSVGTSTRKEPLAASPGKEKPKAFARGFFGKPKTPQPSPQPKAARKEVLGGVLERPSAESSLDPSRPPPSLQPVAAAREAEGPPKKVSRFKQQRMAGQSRP